MKNTKVIYYTHPDLGKFKRIINKSWDYLLFKNGITGHYMASGLSRYGLKARRITETKNDNIKKIIEESRRIFQKVMTRRKTKKAV